MTDEIPTGYIFYGSEILREKITHLRIHHLFYAFVSCYKVAKTYNLYYKYDTLLKKKCLRQFGGKRMLKSVENKMVMLLPGLFRERFELNSEYLKSLSNQGLLQNFYLEAGIIIPGLQVMHDPSIAQLHWGWEAPTCQLRGHFLGHWLSAAASIYASEGDYELKAKLDTIVDELHRCQELNGGEWIGSIPEKYFDKLEMGQNIWSPQYVMHKTILGLMHAYTYAGNKTALEVIDKLSNWYVKWTDEMLLRNPHAIYKGEESGMLELWATLYEITNQEKYFELAKKYSEPGIFRDLLEGKDALTSCHANASIPWSHGAAKLYEITGEEKWKQIVEAFWKCAVTDRGYYCTGGQNAGEYWTHPYRMGHFQSESNQEFCTVYNMVRTASYLYKWTGDTAYADYIEKNLYNGFLAQQNKYTGMPTYFLPMKAGSKKKWGSKTHDFWCCHGTMVQAQTLYNSLIYFEGADRLVVGQYIPSKLNWVREDVEVTVEQCVNMKYYNDLALFDEKDDSQMSRWSLKFQIAAPKAERFTLSLRVPGWVKEKPSLTINGEKIDDYEIVDGYINIDRAWQLDEILIFFPAELALVPLEDIPESCAVVEGPIVLAGLCDKERELYCDKEKLEETFLPQYEHTYSVFPWKQGSYKTLHQAKNMEFVPLYDVTDENYAIYFNVASNTSTP